MYWFDYGPLLNFHPPFIGRTQLTGEREKCYLVGLEASGWGMGGRKGTKGSYPEARPANGERSSDAPAPAVPRGRPSPVVAAHLLFRVDWMPNSALLDTRKDKASTSFCARFGFAAAV